MIFKQFYLESLGHASYLVGSEQTGEAFVLDPRRDVGVYFEEARRHGLRLRYAFDTHQHNDYLTGVSELTVRGEIEVLVGSEAKVAFPKRPMQHGAKLEMGEVGVEVLHTPGHTPEHISLLLTDRSRGKEPTLLLSGGALLVGDIGRPDLLGGEDQTRSLTKAFFHTLQEKILKLPDFVEVYPTHVAGSLCGGHIGTRLSTTLGYERKMNKMFQNFSSEEAFAKDAIDFKNLPAIPPYWSRMRKLNSQGPPLLGVLREPAALKVDAFDAARKTGAIVLDCRSPEAFAVHIPGAQNVGVNALFPVWAGSVLPYDKPIVLVLDRPDDLWPVCWELLRVGFDLPIGWLSGDMTAWRRAGKELEKLPQWTVWELEQQMKSEEIVIFDVRQPGEYEAGHIRGSRHLPGTSVGERLRDFPEDKTVAVICGSGYRSSVVGSFVQRHGRRNVVNIIGGMSGWRNAGLPVEKHPVVSKI